MIMSKKKRKGKITVQKIKEDPVWKIRAESVAQYNLILQYFLDTMLKELERIYKGVQG